MAEIPDRAPNQITAHNAGWRIQFRFAGGASWSGVCEFTRYAEWASSHEPD